MCQLIINGIVSILLQSTDIEMDDINWVPNEAKKLTEKPTDVDLVQATQNVSVTSVETRTISHEDASTSSVELKAKTPINESLSIVIDDDGDEEDRSISPPRKSARLEAKRRDSTTENETCSRRMSESPVPKRRSMRLNSSSSQDAPSPKPREETVIKKMPTITENEKNKGQCEVDSVVKNNSEQALVDELAAAFVDEFIE